MHSDHEDRVVLRAARDAAGGAQRLAHRAQETCDSNPIPAGRPTMNTNLATLVLCESVLDPILEQLATVLDEHSPNFAGGWMSWRTGPGRGLCDAPAQPRVVRNLSRRGNPSKGRWSSSR
jgi:hypothetical protein